MGYYTRFELEWSPHNQQTDCEIGIAIDSNEEMRYCLNQDGSSEESGKWYDHEADMSCFSKQFPKITFILSGSGEEAIDEWKEKYKNGKVQYSRVKRIYSKWSNTDCGRIS